MCLVLCMMPVRAYHAGHPLNSLAWAQATEVVQAVRRSSLGLQVGDPDMPESRVSLSCYSDLAHAVTRARDPADRFKQTAWLEFINQSVEATYRVSLERATSPRETISGLGTRLLPELPKLPRWPSSLFDPDGSVVTLPLPTMSFSGSGSGACKR